MVTEMHMGKRGKRKYQGRLFTRERIYSTGDRLEVSVYPVFQKPGQRRAKCKPTSEVQQRLNEKESINRAIRIAEENFRPGDFALDLTYETEPADMKEAQRILNAYVKRLRRLYDAKGIVLKYMKRSEKGVRAGRIHHHLYITGGVDRDTVEEMWGQGRCNTRRLQFGKDGIEGLTAYICGQGKTRDTYRRWSCSRNCVRPEPEIRDGKLDVEEADEIGEAASMGLGFNFFEELYPGYECVSCEGVKNGTNRGWYTYAVLRRREPENAA